MEIWLDTIDKEAIIRANDLGLLHGVTTNPSILAEAKVPAEEYLELLLTLFAGPLAVQVTLPTASEMIEQGKDLYEFSQRIIVKVPVTEQGIAAIVQLSRLRIPVMATTILEPVQGLMAIKAGARYLAPYFSHMGENALSYCVSMQKMLSPDCKLLIAALREPKQVVQCAEVGFAAVTLKASLFQHCLTPPSQTLEHLSRFEAAWEKAPASQLLPAREFIE